MRDEVQVNAEYGQERMCSHTLDYLCNNSDKLCIGGNYIRICGGELKNATRFSAWFDKLFKEHSLLSFALFKYSNLE